MPLHVHTEHLTCYRRTGEAAPRNGIERRGTGSLLRNGATVVHATPAGACCWKWIQEGLKRAVGAEPLPRDCAPVRGNNSRNFAVRRRRSGRRSITFALGAPVVLGRPLANTQIYIRTELWRVGVLAKSIGGDGVAAVIQPARLRQRFLRPFA